MGAELTWDRCRLLRCLAVRWLCADSEWRFLPKADILHRLCCSPLQWHPAVKSRRALELWHWRAWP